MIDGLVRRRLDRPFVRRDGKLVAVSWNEAFDVVAEAATQAGGSVAAVAGDLVDCETMYAAKLLLGSMGSSLLEGRQTGLDYDTTSFAAVNFNTTIAGLERADAILLLGTNLRWEASLLNTRVRKAIKRGARVYAIGPELDLTYPATWLGNDLAVLSNLPGEVTDLFGRAERPAIIVGAAALKGGHGAALAFAKQFNLVREGWNGFNVVHMAASRMGSLLLGYARPGGIGDVAHARLTFFLGADEVDFTRFSGFKVYVGHHGDRGAAAADVVLPGASYAEKSGTYVNLEGRVQRGERAVFPPGDAREDWSIFRALSERLGHALPFDSLAGLREHMGSHVPQLAKLGLVTFDWNPPSLSATASGSVERYPIQDFYLTNAICRASPTMQRCSAELIHGESFAEAAE